MINILTLDGATIVIVKFWKTNVKLISDKNYNLQQYLTNNNFLIRIAVNSIVLNCKKYIIKIIVIIY